MLAVMIDDLAVPELPDERDRLLEHGQPDLRDGPVIAENVLVEGFAGAHAEPEPGAAVDVSEELGGRRGSLGKDRRMDADDRRRDGGRHAQR